MSGEVYLLWLLSLLQTVSLLTPREPVLGIGRLPTSLQSAGSAYQPTVSCCLRTGLSCRPRPAGSWASPVTSCVAPATCWGSSASPSCNPSAGSAASRRLRWNHASSTPERSWRCVDENWGGSLKSRLLSGARCPRCLKVFRSSTSEAPIPS